MKKTFRPLQFSDPDERRNTLRELRLMQDALVEAQISDDVEYKIQQINCAARVACRYLSILWRGMTNVIDEAIEGVGIADPRVSLVPLSVLMDQNKDLSELRYRDTFRDYLFTIVEVIVQQGHLNQKMAEFMVNKAVDGLESILDQRVSTPAILENIAGIKRAVCKPPNGGLKSAGEESNGPRGPGGGGMVEALRHLVDDYGRIILILTAFGLMTVPPNQRDEPPPPPPPSKEIVSLLLVICQLANEWREEGKITAPEELIALDPAGEYYMYMDSESMIPVPA